jgi:Domain of unknown function (DUF4382)
MSSKPLGIAFAALLLAGSACSKSGKVSVSAQSVTAADTTTTPTSGTLDLGNGIVVSRVRVAVQRIALEGTEAATPDGGTGGADDPAGHSLVAEHGSADGGGNDDGDDDADEVKVGPFLIDLTGDKLTAGISQVFDADVPAGTYREIKVVIAPVAAADAGSNTGLADMNGQSIIVDGTVDGTAFSFQSTIHVAQKQESSIVVASDGSSSNVTLTIDPKTWFVASDGTRLDPSAAASKSQIEDDIRRSVKAFCDHDRNGEDDGHQRCGADDGAGHT